MDGFFEPESKVENELTFWEKRFSLSPKVFQWPQQTYSSFEWGAEAESKAKAEAAIAIAELRREEIERKKPLWMKVTRCLKSLDGYKIETKIQKLVQLRLEEFLDLFEKLEPTEILIWFSFSSS